MKRLMSAATTAGLLLYPLIVYFGLHHVEARWLAVFPILLLLARLGRGVCNVHKTRGISLQDKLTALLVLAIVVYTLSSNQLSGLRLYPALLSFMLLLSFGWSLQHPPSAIERIARLTNPDLSPEGVGYTRKVTQIWCGFFLCNGLIALYTALWTSMEVWTVYNGLVSYLLIGALLAGEFAYRHLRRKKT